MRKKGVCSYKLEKVITDCSPLTTTTKKPIRYTEESLITEAFKSLGGPTTEGSLNNSLKKLANNVTKEQNELI